MVVMSNLIILNEVDHMRKTWNIIFPDQGCPAIIPIMTMIAIHHFHPHPHLHPHIGIGQIVDGKH